MPTRRPRPPLTRRSANLPACLRWCGSVGSVRARAQIRLQSNHRGNSISRLQRIARQIPVDRRGIVADSLVQLLGQQLQVRLGGLAFAIDGRMRFEQQLAVHVGHFHRIVDQPDLGADGHERKQRGDILRVHANATVSDRHPNSHRIVGSVEHVTAVANGETHGEVAERIVRAGGHDLRQRIAVRDVFLADRLRRIPGRMLLLGDDLRLPQRRAPVHFADAHRIGDHHRLLAFLGLREVVQPMLGKIHHDPFVRTGRKNSSARQQNVGALARQPHIYVRDSRG